MRSADFVNLEGEAKAEVSITVAGIVVVTISRTTVPGTVVIAAATIHSIRARRMT